MRLPSTIRLNDRQELFVKAIASGMAPADASRSAGYGGDARHLLRSPSVLHAIEVELRRVLTGELAPLAFRFIRSVLADTESKYGERVKADVTRMVLDRSGYVTVSSNASACTEDKEPDQMTTEELRAACDKLERELAQRAKDVTPSSEPEDRELADLL